MKNLNKLQRLRAANAVAPVLRDQVQVKPRRVGILDEHGKIKGYTTLDKAQLAVLKRAKIELTVHPGTKGEKPYGVCIDCGTVVILTKRGGQRRLRCVSCVKEIGTKRTKIWRSVHPEEVRYQKHKRYVSNNKKTCKAERDRYAKNKEKSAKRTKIWRAANRELVKKIKRKWRAANRERINAERRRKHVNKKKGILKKEEKDQT